MTAAIDDTVAEKVREQEDALRELAETDLRVAKYARELLALAAENGGCY